LGPDVAELVDVVGVLVELAGADRGGVARVEDEHDDLAAVLLEGVGAVALVGVVGALEREARDHLADCRAHQASMPSNTASGMSTLLYTSCTSSFSSRASTSRRIFLAASASSTALVLVAIIDSSEDD